MGLNEACNLLVQLAAERGKGVLSWRDKLERASELESEATRLRSEAAVERPIAEAAERASKEAQEQADARHAALMAELDRREAARAEGARRFEAARAAQAAKAPRPMWSDLSDEEQHRQALEARRLEAAKRDAEIQEERDLHRISGKGWGSRTPEETAEGRRLLALERKTP